MGCFEIREGLHRRFYGAKKHCLCRVKKSPVTLVSPPLFSNFNDPFSGINDELYDRNLHL